MPPQGECVLHFLSLVGSSCRSWRAFSGQPSQVKGDVRGYRMSWVASHAVSLTMASLVQWSCQLRHTSRRAGRGHRGTRALLPTGSCSDAHLPLHPFLLLFSHAHCTLPSHPEQAPHFPALLPPAGMFSPLLWKPQPARRGPLCARRSLGIPSCGIKLYCFALLLSPETYRPG